MTWIFFLKLIFFTFYSLLWNAKYINTYPYWFCLELLKNVVFCKCKYIMAWPTLGKNFYHITNGLYRAKKGIYASETHIWIQDIEDIDLWRGTPFNLA